MWQDLSARSSLSTPSLPFDYRTRHEYLPESAGVMTNLEDPIDIASNFNAAP